jgi:hypothetical protein
MQNKFTLEQFIETCKNNSTFKLLGIEITKDLFKKIGLKPNPIDGFYHSSQILDLRRLIINYEDELQDVLNEPNDDILTLNTLGDDTATQNLQIQHLIYLILTDKFQKFIKEKREIFAIPNEGFKSYKERLIWLNKFAQEIKKQGKISFKEAKNLVWNCIFRLVLKECKKYKLTSRDNFLYANFIQNCFYFNDPFFEKKINPYETDKFLKTSYKYPIMQKNPRTGHFELNIIIFKETTKDDIIKTLNKEWTTVNKWKKKLPATIEYRKKSYENLKRDFMVYNLHRKGLNDQKIQLTIKDGSLELNHIRKIISDTKKRIKETWQD